MQSFLDLSGTGALKLDRYFALLLIPSFHFLSRQTLHSETTRRQAVIACALERYFLAHQSYPATLGELMPAYLEYVPNDLMDQKPMRYRRENNGRYILWSVAFDKNDDDGKIIFEPGKPVAARKLFHPDYQGDWTWQYTSVEDPQPATGTGPTTMQR